MSTQNEKYEAIYVNLSECFGSGGFGKVYMGSGVVLGKVAVKRPNNLKLVDKTTIRVSHYPDT